jgi:hypothetical protein
MLCNGALICTGILGFADAPRRYRVQLLAPFSCQPASAPSKNAAAQPDSFHTPPLPAAFAYALSGLCGSQFFHLRN